MKLLIVGAGGAMGQKVAALAHNQSIETITGIDIHAVSADFPIYGNFAEIAERPDVLVDFSAPAALDGILNYALKNKIPCVLATTGYGEEQIKKIHAAACVIPVFFTANFSLGVNLLCALSRIAANVLGEDFDIEIIEKHHRKKVDAPSGTALMLATAINDERGNALHCEYDRHSKRLARGNDEIGIHSVRGGTIVGEHEVLFAGTDETLTLTHRAESKTVFAGGALKAARFLIGRKPGLYDMNDLLQICAE